MNLLRARPLRKEGEREQEDSITCRIPGIFFACKVIQIPGLFEERPIFVFVIIVVVSANESTY